VNLVGILLGVAAVALGAVAVRLQLVQHGALASEGDARSMRVVATAAHRGTLSDRFDEPLAVSTPVDSLWVNPRELAAQSERLPRLEKALGTARGELARKVSANLDRGFLYLARGLQPTESRKLRTLGIDGLNFTREYRRYYPAGEVTGHLLGFTNIDDAGQDGLELALDDKLAGEDGSKRVIQDSKGRRVEDIESLRAVRPGQDQKLSLDLRIQYLAYRALKSAVAENNAKAGSVIVIDVQTGEILAMVNQPAFNPNDRKQLMPAAYRNRAVTDLMEPGSSIKPFVVAAALASGRYDAGSIIDTGPGFMQVGASVVTDEHKLGAVSIATVLAKSSNVGMAKIALSLEPKQIWTTLSALGFGQVTNSNLPAESAGLLSGYSNWRNVTVASISRGYNIAVTPLQLVQAYATIGAYGVRRPVTLQRVDTAVVGQQVLSADVCRTLIGLLEAVTTESGATGLRAQIPGYRVAGKTGTAKKAFGGSYYDDRYVASFGGLVPASNPRLATIVVIDEPSAGKYYASDVAAPVFAEVMGGALRLLGIPPDAPLAPGKDEHFPAQRVARR
jgi:cell division protein FtsI (penicillin-binding protein 3)